MGHILPNSIWHYMTPVDVNRPDNYIFDYWTKWECILLFSPSRCRLDWSFCFCFFFFCYSKHILLLSLACCLSFFSPLLHFLNFFFYLSSTSPTTPTLFNQLLLIPAEIKMRLKLCKWSSDPSYLVLLACMLLIGGHLVLILTAAN